MRGVEDHEGILGHDLHAAGDLDLVGGAPDRSGVELAEEGLGRGARHREVPSLEATQRLFGGLGRGRGVHEPGAALARHPHGDRLRVRVELADHQGAVAPDDFQLLGGDLGDAGT